MSAPQPLPFFRFWVSQEDVPDFKDVPYFLELEIIHTAIPQGAWQTQLILPSLPPTAPACWYSVQGAVSSVAVPGHPLTFTAESNKSSACYLSVSGLCFSLIIFKSYKTTGAVSRMLNSWIAL